MKQAVAACLALPLVFAFTGCSSDGKKVASSTATTTNAKSAKSAPTSLSAQTNTAVDPSSLVTGSTHAVSVVAPSSHVSLVAPAQVQFILGSQPFGPTPVAAGAVGKSINANLPVTGIAASVQQGGNVKPAQVTKPVSVVWMSASTVVKIDEVTSCSGQCPTLTAPAGASKVMVIPQSQTPGLGAGTAVIAG